MNQDQQPRPWWKDNRLAWVLAALASTSLVIISIVRGMTTNPLLTAFAAFILTTAVVVGLTLSSHGYDGNFLENILVEAHGMLLDILVIGIFILWLNRLGDKRLEIRRYQEEIEDFRGWDSDEAGYRIAGNIKRLSRNGITDIRLERCHLVKVNLTGADLRAANLSRANLSSAYLRGTNLSGVNLRGANLSSAHLRRANLSSAHLRYADLRGADLRNARLEGANLHNANLSRANLYHAALSRTRQWTNGQLAQAESLVGATLPDGTVMTEGDWEEFKKSYR
jgi:uncharacterized protein YjbI with pentapeptide repeats